MSEKEKISGRVKYIRLTGLGGVVCITLPICSLPEQLSQSHNGKCRKREEGDVQPHIIPAARHSSELFMFCDCMFAVYY